MQAKRKPAKKALSPVQIEEVARLFGLLSEPARLKILSALMGGGCTVGDLVDATGLKQGNVSKHLGLLLTEGLVAREKDGNFAHYSIAEPLLVELCGLVCRRSQEKAKRQVRSLVG